MLMVACSGRAISRRGWSCARGRCEARCCRHAPVQRRRCSSRSRVVAGRRDRRRPSIVRPSDRSGLGGVHEPAPHRLHHATASGTLQPVPASQQRRRILGGEARRARRAEPRSLWRGHARGRGQAPAVRSLAEQEVQRSTSTDNARARDRSRSLCTNGRGPPWAGPGTPKISSQTKSAHRRSMRGVLGGSARACGSGCRRGWSRNGYEFVRPRATS